MTTATVEINGRTYNKTAEFYRRISESLDETERHLNRELAYSEDLQHKDMIEFYQKHIVYLKSLLS